MAFSTQDSDEVLSEINVTPLVDVMLVLLVVFIVTAPLLTNAIPINLPKTEAVAPVEQKDPLVVSIDGAGKVFINKDEIQPDLLEFNLQAAKAKDPQVRVQLQADDGVNYGEVARAMASIFRTPEDRARLASADRPIRELLAIRPTGWHHGSSTPTPGLLRRQHRGVRS